MEVTLTRHLRAEQARAVLEALEGFDLTERLVERGTLDGLYDPVAVGPGADRYGATRGITVDGDACWSGAPYSVRRACGAQVIEASGRSAAGNECTLVLVRRRPNDGTYVATVVYSGSRGALFQGGNSAGDLALRAIHPVLSHPNATGGASRSAAMADERAMWRVTRYVTAGRRLRWDETLRDYMRSERATSEEVAEYLLARPFWAGELPDYPALRGVPVGLDERRRCAAFDEGAVRLARRLERWMRT